MKTMSTTRRTYSREFKREAVELAARRGRSMRRWSRADHRQDCCTIPTVAASVASHDDRARLQAAQVQVSMSRTGNCHDNTLMGSFWATLKTELVEDESYASHRAARNDIFLYIEGFYNLRRRHSALGYLSPIEFERRHSLAFNAQKATGA
jgi:putative transposase